MVILFQIWICLCAASSWCTLQLHKGHSKINLNLFCFQQDRVKFPDFSFRTNFLALSPFPQAFLESASAPEIYAQVRDVWAGHFQISATGMPKAEGMQPPSASFAQSTAAFALLGTRYASQTHIQGLFFRALFSEANHSMSLRWGIQVYTCPCWNVGPICWASFSKKLWTRVSLWDIPFSISCTPALGSSLNLQWHLLGWGRQVSWSRCSM